MRGKENWSLFKTGGGDSGGPLCHSPRIAPWDACPFSSSFPVALLPQPHLAPTLSLNWHLPPPPHCTHPPHIVAHLLTVPARLPEGQRVPIYPSDAPPHWAGLTLPLEGPGPGSEKFCEASRRPDPPAMGRTLVSTQRLGLSRPWAHLSAGWACGRVCLSLPSPVFTALGEAGVPCTKIPLFPNKGHTFSGFP